MDVTSGHGEDSWEARMTEACQSKFAVSPRKGDAIVFYSQHPDGNVNPASLRTYRRWHLHVLGVCLCSAELECWACADGGCPVLEGTKWAANLW